MAQFWAYHNSNPGTQSTYPYLLDIQSDFLSELHSTVVIPLMPQSHAAGIALSRLNPLLPVNGIQTVLMTQDLAGISRSQLQASVCDLRTHRADILAALDFLILGI